MFANYEFCKYLTFCLHSIFIFVSFHHKLIIIMNC